MSNSFHHHINRVAVTRNITARYGHDSKLQKLMSGLSNKELKILQKNSDLVHKLHEISKMDLNTATICLEEDFNLSLEAYIGDSCWIGVEDLEESKPKWINNTHVGWSVEGIKDFQNFALNFMLQEVRINIWMRYYAHKKESKSAKKETLEHSYGLYM